jgi:hypothetical protein
MRDIGKSAFTDYPHPRAHYISSGPLAQRIVAETYHRHLHGLLPEDQAAPGVAGRGVYARWMRRVGGKASNLSLAARKNQRLLLGKVKEGGKVRRASSEEQKKLLRDVSNEPRDDHGRWTFGGGP